MSGTYVTLPAGAAKTGHLALDVMVNSLRQCLVCLPDTEGPRQRNVLTELIAQGNQHKQVFSAAIAAAGPSMATVATPLITEALDFIDSAQKTLCVDDYGDALAGAERCLRALRLAFSVEKKGGR